MKPTKEMKDVYLAIVLELGKLLHIDNSRTMNKYSEALTAAVFKALDRPMYEDEKL